MIYSVKIDFKGVNGAKTEKLIFFGTFWSEFGWFGSLKWVNYMTPISQT